MENNNKFAYHAAKQVLIFNRARTLIAVARSIRSAAELSHCNPQSVSCACTGENISSGGFYFRHLHPDVYLEMDDLDRLSLNEYDRLCKNDRVYYSTKEMVRKEKTFMKSRITKK